MALGPDFVFKAARRVRTAAGVKFFKAPIGTIITPGMVDEAKRQHGEKRVQTVLEAQKRNAVRDGRRAHFQNQADVRHNKREEAANARAAARARAKQKAEADIAHPVSALVSPQKPVVVHEGAVGEKSVAGKEPPQGKKKQEKGLSRVLDLVHQQGKWGKKDGEDAITLLMQYRSNQDPEVRSLIQALLLRLKKEDV